MRFVHDATSLTVFYSGHQTMKLHRQTIAAFIVLNQTDPRANS